MSKFQKVSPVFNSIINKIPNVLLAAREQNTIKNYWGCFEKWVSWSEQFTEVSPMPSEEIHIIIYLLTLLQTGKNYPVIKSTLYAIKFFHKIIGFEEPCKTNLTTLILEGIKRICCHTTQKKDPITPEQLQKIYELLGGERMTLLNLRTLLISVLSFMGFLRFSEVITLTLGDIIIHETHISIFIEKSKTDVYRDGYWVYLAKLHSSSLCPKSLLEKYIKIAKINKPEHFLFRQILHTKNKFRLKRANKPISYSTTRENLLSALQKIGLEPKNYGLHSLRAGGATSAANLGVEDRLFQKHGRWKSVNVKNGYIHEDLNSLLSVSKNLGL